MLSVGTRVKYTTLAALPKRDAWQGSGKVQEKAMYKKAYDAYVQKRGKITAANDKGYLILWEDGSTSETISYLVEESFD